MCNQVTNIESSFETLCNGIRDCEENESCSFIIFSIRNHEVCVHASLINTLQEAATTQNFVKMILLQEYKHLAKTNNARSDPQPVEHRTLVATNGSRYLYIIPRSMNGGLIPVHDCNGPLRIARIVLQKIDPTSE